MTLVKFLRIHKLQNTACSLEFCKLCTSMPEDGRGQPKHVAYNVRFNKFGVFNGIISITSTLRGA